MGILGIWGMSVDILEWEMMFESLRMNELMLFGIYLDSVW